MDICQFIKCLLIDKDYKGQCEEKKAKLSCDTPGTKAKIVGDSLKMALELLKKDINGAVGESKRAAGSSHDNT